MLNPGSVFKGRFVGQFIDVDTVSEGLAGTLDNNHPHRLILIE
jgi:hypothetical protein